MQEKDLKKLNRLQILELFLNEREKNEVLERHVHELRRRLDDRGIQSGTAGSMEEASESLNDIFASADREAEKYLESIRQIDIRMQELKRAESESEIIYEW